MALNQTYRARLRRMVDTGLSGKVLAAEHIKNVLNELSAVEIERDAWKALAMARGFALECADPHSANRSEIWESEMRIKSLGIDPLTGERL